MKLNYYKNALERRLKQSHYRQFKHFTTHTNVKDIINFSYLDPLQLSSHNYVKKNAIKMILKWGAGSIPSGGLINCHLEMEKKFQKLIGYESLLVTPQSDDLYTKLLSSLKQSKSVIFIDEKCAPHILKSVRDICKHVITYQHNDLNHLNDLIESTSGPNIILTESVFGVDGSLCNIREIISIAKKSDALLIVDDSHSFTLFGEMGLGVCSNKSGIDVCVSSCDKTLGIAISYIATSEVIKSYLTQINPSFNTYLPPSLIGTMDALLDLVIDMDVERDKLLKLSSSLRKKLF